MMSSSNELVVAGTTWATMRDQCAVLVKGGLLPHSINTPEKALTIALMGHEVKMPIMWSLNNIDVIQGKATLKPVGMLALIYKNCPGALINFLEQTNEKCVIEACRPGGKFSVFSFTFDDAKKMNLTGKDNWIKQPGTMLMWRCVAKMARALFPDALAGILYTPEELNPDVVIDSEGQVISVTAETEKPATIVKEESKKEETIFSATNPDHAGKMKIWCLKQGILDAKHIEEIIKRMDGKSLTSTRGVVNELEEELKEFAAGPNE